MNKLVILANVSVPKCDVQVLKITTFKCSDGVLVGPIETARALKLRTGKDISSECLKLLQFLVERPFLKPSGQV